MVLCFLLLVSIGNNHLSAQLPIQDKQVKLSFKKANLYRKSISLPNGNSPTLLIAQLFSHLTF